MNRRSVCIVCDHWQPHSQGDCQTLQSPYSPGGVNAGRKPLFLTAWYIRLVLHDHGAQDIRREPCSQCEPWMVIVAQQGGVHGHVYNPHRDHHEKIRIFITELEPDSGRDGVIMFAKIRGGINVAVVIVAGVFTHGGRIYRKVISIITVHRGGVWRLISIHGDRKGGDRRLLTVISLIVGCICVWSQGYVRSICLVIVIQNWKDGRCRSAHREPYSRCLYAQ